MPDGNTSFRSF